MKRNIFCVIYATFPDLPTARCIIKGLLKNKLIACGNIFRLSSLYVWKGVIEDSAEYGALLKTKKTKYAKVEAHIKKHHPYEVPEIISWTLERGLKQYLQWLNKET